MGKQTFELKFKPKSRRLTKRYDMVPTQEISESWIEEEIEDNVENRCVEIIEDELDDWFSEEPPQPPPPPGA